MTRICIIREWYFPTCARASREAEALVRAGHDVDVICVGLPGEPRVERVGRVTIYRLPIARRRGSLLRYFFEFATFQIAATVLVGMLHLRRRYDVVQVNSLPDWLVFAAIVPRLFGARVVLDLHECMPEYFITKWKRPSSHPMVRFLMFLEQASIRFADVVVTCTQQMRDRFVERGAPAEKIGVVLNSFDEDRFDPRRYTAPSGQNGSFVLVCHGMIDENYGIDLVVRAVAMLKDRIPGLQLKIYGDGPSRASVKALARELGVEDHVWLSPGWLRMEDLLPRIAEADAGVVAIRRDAFRDVTHCNKMYDLIALRKPVVISRTRAVQAYFGDGCFQLFESENARDLARAIYELFADPDLGRRLVRHATEVSEPYRWTHQRGVYVDIVERLVASAAARRSPQAIATERVRDG